MIHCSEQKKNFAILVFFAVFHSHHIFYLDIKKKKSKILLLSFEISLVKIYLTTKKKYIHKNHITSYKSCEKKP